VRTESGKARTFWDAYETVNVDAVTPEEIRRVVAGFFHYVAVAKDKTIHWESWKACAVPAGGCQEANW